MGFLLRLLSFQMGVTSKVRALRCSAKLLSDKLCKVPALRLLCKLCQMLLDAPQVGSRS